MISGRLVVITRNRPYPLRLRNGSIQALRRTSAVGGRVRGKQESHTRTPPRTRNTAATTTVSPIRTTPGAAAPAGKGEGNRPSSGSGSSARQAPASPKGNPSANGSQLERLQSAAA